MSAYNQNFRLIGTVGLIALIGLIATVVVGTLAYTFMRLSHLESALSDATHQATLDLKTQQQALEKAVGQLAEMGAQQQEIQSTLSRITSHKEDNWLLAEALYLSRLAVERLQTTQEVKTAILQLTAADERLRQVADPRLMPVRKILVDKIAALKIVNAPDFEGVWLQLGAISERSHQLQAYTSYADKKHLSQDNIGQDAGWKAGLKQTWFEIKNLVKIRSPEENASMVAFAGKIGADLSEAGLKRGLRLLIEQSRWALIQREGWLYQGSLDNAQKWISAYFVQEATAKQLGAELADLKNTPIELSVPDITPTVIAIEAFMQARQQDK